MCSRPFSYNANNEKLNGTGYTQNKEITGDIELIFL